MNYKPKTFDVILSYICSILALGSAAYLKTAYYFLSFPDGHLTALGSKEQVLFPIGIAFSIIFAFLFVYSAFSKKFQSKLLYLIVFLFFLFLITMKAVHYYLSLNFENGIGG